MNTFLSSSQVQLFEDYKKFAEEKISPCLPVIESDTATVKKLIEQIGQAGYLGMCIPKEYGGKGEPFINLVLFIQAISRLDAGLGLAVASHVTACEMLALNGTDTQKSRFLPQLASGETIGTVAVSEALAGSDYKSCQSVVTKDLDNYSLQGEKTWVVNGSLGDLAIVLARYHGASQKEDQVKPLSFWVVDLKETSTVKISEDLRKLGLNSARTNNIEFASTKLEASSVLGGKELEGLDSDQLHEGYLLDAMDFIKVLVAAISVGLTDSILEFSVDRARTREQFGANIGKLQAIQWKLADMGCDSSAARLLTYRAACTRDEAKEQFRKDAAMCKYYAAKVAQIHSSEAVQIYGSYGISLDYPVEKLYRDAKVMEVCEGTSEIQKNIIAQEIGS